MVELSYSRRGLSDWLLQRFSAVILGAYVLVLFLYFLMSPSSLTYSEWHGFMMSVPMRIFNLLAFLALAGHAWVGLWTITTDYIKPWCIRVLAQGAIFIANLVFLLWALVIFFG